MRALLEETRLIHNQHAVLVAERREDVILHQLAQCIGRPAAAAEQGLNAIRPLQSGLFRQHPSGLPLGA